MEGGNNKCNTLSWYFEDDRLGLGLINECARQFFKVLPFRLCICTKNETRLYTLQYNAGADNRLHINASVEFEECVLISSKAFCVDNQQEEKTRRGFRASLRVEPLHSQEDFLRLSPLEIMSASMVDLNPADDARHGDARREYVISIGACVVYSVTSMLMTFSNKSVLLRDWFTSPLFLLLYQVTSTPISSFVALIRVSV